MEKCMDARNMVDLSGAVDWWNEWQLRVLALGSLCAQYLLAFLGRKRGQVIITAYSIEDNELWKRHVVTVVAQVGNELFICCMHFKFVNLANTAICILILATIRWLEKLWAFRRASFNSLIIFFDRASRTTPSLEDQMSLQNYIREARKIVQENNPPPELDFSRQSVPYFDCQPSITKAHGNLFVDLPYPYPERLDHLRSFWLLDEGPTTYHKLLEEGYSKSYVLITSVLLYGTLFLDICHSITTARLLTSWEATVSQHNLIAFFARSRRQIWLVRIAARWLCQDWMDQYWCLEPCDSSSIRALTELIRNSVKTWWTDRVTDANSYRKVNDANGHWTLGCEECKQMLEWSLENPFDGNILIWHVATDFCLHHAMDTPDYAHCVSRSQCREISNYMMYLLFANPEMLMPGSRKNLLTAVNKELDDMFKDEDPPVDREQVMQAILDKVRARSGRGFVDYAWSLAQGLMGLDSDEKMWRVIQGVWVEMLCFSASRSRGYLHAKSLGSGGEILSYIWLLWAHAGMETFSERLQRRRHRRSRGDDDSGPSSSQCTNPVEAENASASSSASKGKEPVKEEEDDAVPSTSQSMGPVKEEDNVASAASSSKGKGDCNGRR
ncbi:uncharacterized protein [Miscanthus floridulus]|uniref:uncharacterized protein n=1 Tax=Miscanthus floridulus TaxID=154761 RepID=UPI003459367B